MSSDDIPTVPWPSETPPEWGFHTWEQLVEWVNQDGVMPPPKGDWTRVGGHAWSSIDPSTLKPGDPGAVYSPNFVPPEKLADRLRQRRNSG